MDGQDESGGALPVDGAQDEREPQTMAELLEWSERQAVSQGPRRDPRWVGLTEQRERGDLLEAPVVEVNRGGAVVDVGLRGFVPLSQLASIGALDRAGAAVPGQVPDGLRSLIGRTLTLKLLEVDPQRDRLILSEKAAVQERRRQRKARAAAELRPGEVLEGTVTHITGFGLFVDVGVADGLVHRSEITWDKAVNPTAVHAVGDTVRVVVTGVDPARERISLSIKRLTPDPWDLVATQFTVGTEADAVITRLMPFGAFARLADGLEGLIHISELADRRVAQPSEAVAVGDRVRVRVVAIDEERRRLSLSIRQATAP